MLFNHLLLFVAALLPQSDYGLDDPTPIGPYLNGNLPDQSPGSSDSYSVVPAFPNLSFRDPLVITPQPRSNRLYVGSRQGLIHWFENQPNVNQKQVFLDIRDRCAVVWDGGFLGLAFHPDFGVPSSPDRGTFFVYYCYTEDGDYPTGFTGGFFDVYLRLSKFQVPDGSNAADPNSEQVMINIRLYNGSHRGGHIAFGADRLLYVPIGDQFRYETAQDIEDTLEGGILRIDVDQDPVRSHPPRRTFPRQHSEEVSGQHYWIPNDNPWLDPGGSIFEEYWTIGNRAPHRMTFDPVTNKLWSGEIGGGRREEINILEAGRNYGWPFREGFGDGPRTEPPSYLGLLQEPVVDFLRNEANAIIGGYVYRGSRTPGLYGQHICAGYSQDRIFAISYDDFAQQYTKRVIGSFGPDAAITFGQDHLGEIYIGRQASNTTLYTLAPTQPSPDPPLYLSDTGAFADLQSLQPAAGFIPYDLNVPFWSDGAIKTRWVAIPNNGTHNVDSEQVVFSENGDWEFPPGTVIIKHFDLPIDDGQPDLTRRLETRFLVIAENDETYGVTYRWLPDQSDAILLTERTEEEIEIQTDSGTRFQTWTYPGRQDCRNCHNNANRGVLGLKTHQVNRDFNYPSSGRTDNQLRTWNHLGIFDSSLDENDIPNLPKATPLGDTNASFEDRARSYLAANCAYCHRQDAGIRAAFDARFSKPLYSTDMIYGAVSDNLGIDGARVLHPQREDLSLSFHRLNGLDEAMMPPLAKNVLDATGVELIRDWIARMDPSLPINIGDLAENLDSLDGWRSNLVINESDRYQNQSGETQEVRVEGFRFYARNNRSPVTPFVVKVFSDNNFEVLKIGTTRFEDDYEPGDNAFSFRDGETPTISLLAGEVIATGFLDASADGTGGDDGSVIPFCVCNGADELWYTGGSGGSDSGRVIEGQAPIPGSSLILNLRRQYAYSLDLVIQAPNTPPSVENPGPQSWREGDRVFLPISGFDIDPADTLEFSATGLPAGLSIDSESGLIAGSLSILGEGSSNITVTVSDGMANESVSFPTEVTSQPFRAIYFSFMSGQTLPGAGTVWDEDIAVLDLETGEFAKYFDGSDVGVREDVRGFHILPDGSLLFCFNQPLDIPGLIGGPQGTTVMPEDLVRFIPTSLGSNTRGDFEFYFDGSDLGLGDRTSHKLDAISTMPDGRLILSTRGTSNIGGAFYRDEDLFAFEGIAGANTSGRVRRIFDGSDVGLGDLNEDVDAAAIDSAGNLILSTYVEFAVDGLEGNPSDVVEFEGSLSWQTMGVFRQLMSEGLFSFEANNISALHVERDS